jgi:hypothetical protein
MNKRTKVGLCLLLTALLVVLLIGIIRIANRSLLDEYEEYDWSLRPQGNPSEGVISSGRFLFKSIVFLPCLSAMSFLVGVPLLIVGIVAKEKRSLWRQKLEGSKNPGYGKDINQ